MKRARELLDKAIELGGEEVRLQAFEDADLERLGAGVDIPPPGDCWLPSGEQFFSELLEQSPGSSPSRHGADPA